MPPGHEAAETTAEMGSELSGHALGDWVDGPCSFTLPSVQHIFQAIAMARAKPEAPFLETQRQTAGLDD